METVLLPGQPIPLQSKAPLPQAGTGTYVRDGVLRASLLGTSHLDGATLSISAPIPPPPIPVPSSVILGTVLRLSPVAATLAITAVDNRPCADEFMGVIRVQDVRSTEKDKVRLGDCFRGGDVVKAVVISLGDARSYYLTTARNDLGVVYATSEAGAIMQPVSWQEMRCPKTGAIEKRKCAKPDNV